MSNPTDDSVRIGPLGVRFLVDADYSNETHTIVEVEVPPDAQMVLPHSHDGSRRPS